MNDRIERLRGNVASTQSRIAALGKQANALRPGESDDGYVHIAPWPAPDREGRDAEAARVLGSDDPEADVSAGDRWLDIDALHLANLVITSELAAAHPAAVARRMDGVVVQRYKALCERLGEGSDFNPAGTIEAMASDWSDAERTVALIELLSADPFLPYEIKHSRKSYDDAMAKVAALIGADEDLVAEVGDVLSQARSSHRRRSLARVGIMGFGAALALGTAGFAAAPVMGAALGTAAGFSGAAATSFGLAALGGSAGMSGGMWLIATSAAGTGFAAGSGGALLYTLGERDVRAELVKLQASYKLVLLRTKGRTELAESALRSLRNEAEEMETRLNEERRLNDDNAVRVTELEAKLEAVLEAIEWMDAQP